MGVARDPLMGNIPRPKEEFDFFSSDGFHGPDCAHHQGPSGITAVVAETVRHRTSTPVGFAAAFVLLLLMLLAAPAIYKHKFKKVNFANQNLTRSRGRDAWKGRLLVKTDWEESGGTRETVKKSSETAAQRILFKSLLNGSSLCSRDRKGL